jgi:hypothetical protein
MHSRIEIVSNGDDTLMQYSITSLLMASLPSNKHQASGGGFFVIGGVLTRVRFLDMTGAT